MKQSLLPMDKELFPGSDIVRKYSFKTMSEADSYTLLAKAHHLLSHAFAPQREKSAHFYPRDCFECLTPHQLRA